MPRVAFAVVSLIVAASVPVAADAQAPQPEKKQCRYLTPTGSYFGTKVCKSRQEWAATDRAHDDAVAKAARNNTADYSQSGQGHGTDSMGQ